MDRVVALKLLSTASIRSANSIERFNREIRAAAQLEHPNIVTAYDAGESDGVHYLVMQYVHSRNLKQLVKQRGRIPVRDAVNYIVQAAQGLEFAHQRGIIHRDVKPANLLLDHTGTIKILDLGLALIHETEGAMNSGRSSTRITMQGQILGTVNYMSPEQALDTHLADPRSDIYSLGASLYYLIVGQPPFTGESVSHVLLAHQEASVPPMRLTVGAVPESLDAAVQKMLAKESVDRYQSMTEVIDALTSAMAETPRVAVAVGAEAQTGRVAYATNDRNPRGPSQGSVATMQFEEADRRSAGEVSLAEETADLQACSDTEIAMPEKPFKAPKAPAVDSPARPRNLVLIAGGSAVVALAAIGFVLYLVYG